MENKPLVFKRKYNAKIAQVWHAITNKEAMKEWYFDLSDFKLEIGFEFEFMGGPDECSQYKHICIITEIQEMKKLTYSWAYEGYDAVSYVTFELGESEGGTILILTHEGLDSFANNPDLAKNNFIEGWTFITGVSLKNYLEI